MTSKKSNVSLVDEAEHFATWIEGQPDTRDFCPPGANYNCHCPIATFLKEAHGLTTAAVTGSCWAGYADQMNSEMLPPWAKTFVAIYDKQPKTCAKTAKEAMARTKVVHSLH